MTARIISNQPEVSTFSFVRETFTGLRRHRARVALRKHLGRLDGRMLRDIGLIRMGVMDGSF